MANRIKLARKALGLSQKDFGKALGVSSTTVSAWEVGRNEPDYKVLRDIARMLDCSIEYLMGYTANKTAAGIPPEPGKVVAFQETLEIDEIFVKKELTKEERKRAVEVIQAMFS